MNKFYIDTAHLCSVTIHKEHKLQQRENESDEDFVMRKLKSEHIRISSVSSEDHPEFAKLREMLGEQGFIHIERGWWNGDRVLKSFYLNDKKFKPGDRFYCASAMHFTLTQ